MTPPPNPHAAEFAAAYREAMQACGLVSAEQPQRKPLAASDAALIEAAMQRWPDMRRYANTARIEQHYDAKRDEWRQVVTVTL